MKKIFISQPMKDKSDEEILKERESITATVKNMISDNIEVLDTFFGDSRFTALECLGKSIEMLSDADIAVFANGWEYVRGCRIEHACCVEYGKKIIYMNGERDDEDRN